MTASIGGALALLVVGIGFLSAGALGWLRRGEGEPDQQRRWLGVGVDVIVGSVALVDAGMGVLDAPARVTLWVAGSVALVVAMAMLVVRHRRPAGRRWPWTTLSPGPRPPRPAR